MCWVATYIEFSDNDVLDQEKQFQRTEFRSMLQAAGIKHIDAVVEIHNALGETERYHAYLQNVFERMHVEHPGLATEAVLHLASKRAMTVPNQAEWYLHCCCSASYRGCLYTRTIFPGSASA